MKKLNNALMVHVRIPTNLLGDLDKLSGHRGNVSRASLIREALQKFIKGEMKNEINY